jgi:asparagine synthase (glutamine-hydrolysing)
VEPECFQRKVKNFCDVYSSNLVLPWSAVPVAQYFSILPEEYLFDRNILKNKLVLRKMLKSKVGLDSDAIGKRGYGFDRSDIVERRWTWVLQSIVDCPLWRPAGVEELTDQLKRISERKGRPAQVANSLIHRLLLISLWYSNNRYIR